MIDALGEICLAVLMVAGTLAVVVLLAAFIYGIFHLIKGAKKNDSKRQTNH